MEEHKNLVEGKFTKSVTGPVKDKVKFVPK
jgi:hypothetical protein